MPNSTADPLAPDVSALVDETLEHVNANHADTVLLLARFAGDTPAASQAEATGADSLGIDLAVIVDGQRAAGRIEFREPATTSAAIEAEFYAALTRAREAAGETVPPTSLEREFTETMELPTFVAEVVVTRDLTPNLREIVVGGPGLAPFVPFGGDEFLFAMVTRPGEPPIPDDYSMATWMGTDEADRPRGAYYTVRRWDAARRELTLWAVLHGHADGVGGFFARCVTGDRLALWGPRRGFWSDGVYAPTGEPRHHLFVTDESGFCAVTTLLERLPGGDAATVIAQTVDGDHTIEFPGARTNVRWRFRDTSATLLELVRETVGHLAAPAVASAFGAGESREITQIRKYLRHELGMPAATVSMTGYWREAAHA